MHVVRKYQAVAFAALVAALIGSIVYLHKDRKRAVRAVQAEQQQQFLSMATRQAELERANAELLRAQAHYVHLYGLYAGIERYRQYGAAADNLAIFYRRQKDFVPIESVTEKTVCPKPVKRLPNGFTYYGIRNVILGRTGQAPLLYSISYMGSHAFVRDRDDFDSLIDLGNPGAGRIVRLPESQAANLMSRAPKPLTRNGSFITPFSFNSRDINNDGTDDFFYGGHLFLSEKGDYEPIADKTLDGREVVFANNEFLSPKGDVIERWSYVEGHLVKVGEVALEAPVATNRPFTILPLGGAVTDRADVIVITASSYDFYALRDGKAKRVMSLPASAPHSVIVGARGDFDGDGKDDLWLTEFALAEQGWQDCRARGAPVIAKVQTRRVAPRGHRVLYSVRVGGLHRLRWYRREFVAGCRRLRPRWKTGSFGVGAHSHERGGRTLHRARQGHCWPLRTEHHGRAGDPYYWASGQQSRAAVLSLRFAVAAGRADRRSRRQRSLFRRCRRRDLFPRHRKAHRGARQLAGYSFTPRSRSALATTLTDESAMAAAAITGDSRMPKTG